MLWWNQLNWNNTFLWCFEKTIQKQLETIDSRQQRFKTFFNLLLRKLSLYSQVEKQLISISVVLQDCAVCAMSLFSWMRRSNGTGTQSKAEATPLKTTGAAANHTLIRELLWHLEEHGHMAKEPEREQRSAQSSRGLYWFEKYPKLRNLISTSELQQLELLCSQIPPVHAAAVLSR